MDKLQYWRESAAGISSLAHFLSKDTIDHFNTIIKPVVYLSMFYFLSNPRSSFVSNYVVLVCLLYCVTGMAYALAIFFDPAPAQLVWIISMISPYLRFFYKLLLVITSLVFSFGSFMSPVVVSASSCHYDSRCQQEEKACIYEDPSRILLPKMGFASFYHCKC